MHPACKIFEDESPHQQLTDESREGRLTKVKHFIKRYLELDVSYDARATEAVRKGKMVNANYWEVPKPPKGRRGVDAISAANSNSNYDGNAEVCNVSENGEIQRIIRVEQHLTDMETRSLKSVSDQRRQVDTLKNDFNKRISIVETKADTIFELCQKINNKLDANPSGPTSHIQPSVAQQPIVYR